MSNSRMRNGYIKSLPISYGRQILDNSLFQNQNFIRYRYITIQMRFNSGCLIHYQYIVPFHQPLNVRILIQLSVQFLSFYEIQELNISSSDAISFWFIILIHSDIRCSGVFAYSLQNVHSSTTSRPNPIRCFLGRQCPVKKPARKLQCVFATFQICLSSFMIQGSREFLPVSQIRKFHQY